MSLAVLTHLANISTSCHCLWRALTLNNKPHRHPLYFLRKTQHHTSPLHLNHALILLHIVRTFTSFASPSPSINRSHLLFSLLNKHHSTETPTKPRTTDLHNLFPPPLPSLSLASLNHRLTPYTPKPPSLPSNQPPPLPFRPAAPPRTPQPAPRASHASKTLSRMKPSAKEPQPREKN